MPIKKNSRVKLKDIADYFGVSANTVSRALKDKSDISSATKKKIISKAKELGYIPNKLAQSMRSGKTHTISMIIGDIANPYFSIMVRELESHLHSNGYYSIIFNTDEDGDIEEQAIKSSIANNVDGVILFPTCKENNSISFLKKSSTPFILVNRHYYDSNSNSNYIGADDILGGYQATNYLIEKGHRDILIISGPQYISCAYERYKGYEKALTNANIPIKEELICQINIIRQESVKSFNEFLNKKIHFTGVFAFNDMLSFEIAFILKQRLGDKKAQKIDIVGYDNIYSHFIYPSIFPTIDIQKEKIAENVVEVLLQKINNKHDNDLCYKVYPTSLILPEQNTSRHVIRTLKGTRAV